MIGGGTSNSPDKRIVSANPILRLIMDSPSAHLDGAKYGTRRGR